MPEPLPLEIENLSYGFKDPLFENVNLTIRHGEFMTVLIEQSVGKSAFIDCLFGNLKPMSGKIRFWGVENRGFNRELIRHRVGWLISKKESYAPWLRIREDMMATSRIYQSWNQNLFMDMVTRLNLNLDQRMSDLTPGVASKVRFIKALAFEPELLVLDEFMAPLNYEERGAVAEILGQQYGNGDLSVLYVCRSLQEAALLSDRVSILGRHGLTSEIRATL